MNIVLILSFLFIITDMECSLNSSRGSRRSFRRNNSMSEISAKSIDEGVFNPQSIHRTSSAPDIHKKGKVRKREQIFMQQLEVKQNYSTNKIFFISVKNFETFFFSSFSLIVKVVNL